MSFTIKSVRNNLFSVTFAQFASFFLNIITFGIIARVLSVEDYGKFNYLLAIVGFTAKFIDLGINPIVLRESAKNNRFSEYIGSVFYVKSLLIILLLVFVNIFSFLVINTMTEKILLNLLIINIFFSNKYTNIRELLVIPYKICLKMEFPMILVLIDNILLLIISIFLKESEHALLYFGLIYLGTNIPSNVILFIVLIKKNEIKFLFNKDFFFRLLKMAFPIYGYVLLMIIYTQIDTILIGIFNGDNSVALYSTAVRLSNPFIIFASAITITFFPIIVNKLKEKKDVAKIIGSVVSLLILFSSTISLFIFFYSKDIIRIVFGENYMEESEPLQFLGISIIFLFINFFLVDLLTAFEKQKNNFIYGILINLLSLPFYFIFLPEYSYVSASIIKLSVIFVGSIYLFLSVNRIVKIRIHIFKLMIWFFLNFIVFSFLQNLNLYYAIFIECIFVSISILILRVLTYDEIMTILSMLNIEKFMNKFSFWVEK